MFESNDNFEFNKNKGPYHGVFIVCLFTIGIPLVLLWAFYNIILHNQHYSTALALSQSFVLAGAIGVAICIMTFFTGGLSDSFKIVITRLSEFYDAIRYESLSHAISWYWQNVKVKGLVFWLYLAITAFNLFLVIKGIKTFISLQ